MMGVVVVLGNGNNTVERKRFLTHVGVEMTVVYHTRVNVQCQRHGRIRTLSSAGRIGWLLGIRFRVGRRGWSYGRGLCRLGFESARYMICTCSVWIHNKITVNITH